MKGASKTLLRENINIMILEFTGERELLSYLSRFPVTVFDSPYVFVMKEDDTPLQDWDILSTGNLSSGKKSYTAYPKSGSTKFGSYIEFFDARKQNFEFMQTDLIIVMNSFLPAFHNAMRKASENATR